MRTHTRFFLVDQFAVPIVFNFLLNGWLASQLFAHLPAVPLWGAESIGLDTLATSFLLPFLTFVITARVLGFLVRWGKVEPLVTLPSGHLPSRLVDALSRQRASLSGAGFGLACAATLGSLTLVVFRVLRVESLELRDFLWFKAAYAALLTAFVSVIIAWACLIRISREAGAHAPVSDNHAG